MSFRLINKSVEYIIDLFSDKCPKAKKFSVNPMQCGFQKISFSWIFTVKEFQKLKHKLLIYMLFHK